MKKTWNAPQMEVLQLKETANVPEPKKYVDTVIAADARGYSSTTPCSPCPSDKCTL